MIEEKTEVNLLNDAMFKALFRSKEARGVIATVISALLGIDKKKLIYADYGSGELVKNKLFEKGKICDIIIKIDSGNKIILEMNQMWTNNIFDKNTTYSFTIINESIIRKEKKYIYPNIVLINFDAFNKFGTSKGILEFKIRDEEGHIETEIYRSIHLILENLVNTEYNKDVRKLAKFLRTTDMETLRKDYKGDSNYMACIRRVEELSTDPDFVGYYDIEEAHRQEINDSYDTGYDSGYDEGLNKGINQRNIELAKMMLQEGIDIKTISKIAKLTEEEIKKLSSEE